MAEQRGLTSEEAVRYDRQMRLWGVEAQLRLMKSRVLLVNIAGLGTEIAKNLVLGGVGELSLYDETLVSDADLGINFLLSSDDIGSRRAEASIKDLADMNSLVKLHTLKTLTDIPENAYDCAIITDASKEQSAELARKCRAAGVPVIICSTFGLLALAFSDFGSAFSGSQEMPSGSKTQFSCPFSTFDAVFAEGKDWAAAKPLQSFVGAQIMWQAACESSSNEKDARSRIATAAKEISKSHNVVEPPGSYLDKLAVHCVGQLSPVCSVAGGVLAQEVLKVIQKNAKPMVNFFVYDALEESKGYSETIL